jgi:hypothetical protein
MKRFVNGFGSDAGIGVGRFTGAETIPRIPEQKPPKFGGFLISLTTD